MSDLDLEELETRLYNQVYHGLAEEEVENALIVEPQPNNPSKQIQAMGKQRGRYFGPWSPTSRFQNRLGPRTPGRSVNNDSIYSKNYGKSPKSQELSFKQVVVVNPKSPIIYNMNAKERKKELKKARYKERRLQRRADKQRAVQQAKAEYKIQARKQARKQLKKMQEIENSSVITLSDSEDDRDSCVLIDNNWPVLSVADSDDEDDIPSESENLEVIKNNITLKNEPQLERDETCTDDVIFVEPEITPIEIINIDPEIESSPEKNISILSDVNVTTQKIAKKLHKERKELLSTPDSASNDFMNSSGVEFSDKFNFSLHGSDFRDSEFAKPAPRNETCETESSSSTTDANSTVHLMETAVFNEVDFPREDIFSENNLESFGNFITPLRNPTIVKAAQSSPVVQVASDVQNKIVYSSDDSSSESDLEDSQNERVDVVSKNRPLPELSPMQASAEILNKSQVKKAKKNCNNMSNKFDLIASESPSQKIKQKDVQKKKKNKKKKSGESSSDEVLNKIDGSSGIDDELMKKKRRSGQFEDSENVAKKRASDVAGKEEQASIPAVNKDVEMKEKSKDSDKQENKNDAGLKCKKQSAEKQVEKSLEKQAEKSPVEKTPEKQEEKPSEKQTNLKLNLSNEALSGFEIIDETFDQEAPILLSSDAESVLSPLNENSDIQLNCEAQNEENEPSPVEIPESRMGLHNCSVQDIQRTMSSEPYLWEILESDIYPSGKSRGPRCKRCKEFGHIAVRCRIRVQPKCTLCGQKGHFETRCPNTLCTQCGRRSSYSTNYCGSCFKYRNSRCRLCSMMGHLPSNCPDLWRRYHLTTKEGPLKFHPVPKEKKELWCSGCAKSGHLEHTCRRFRSIYPPTDPYIKSYDDVYNNNETEERQVQQPPPLLPTPLLQINKQVYQSFDDHQNYDQNNYGQSNQPFVSPLLRPNLYVANQQNFYASVEQGLVQNFQNDFSTNYQNLQNNYVQSFNYHNVQNNFPPNQPVFENVLPSFISLESQDNVPNCQESREDNFLRKVNYVFFSSTTLQMQHFIKTELQKLSVLALRANKYIKEVKKTPLPKTRRQCFTYYGRANMLLFGVLNLSQGKTHLNRLKQFRMEGTRAAIDGQTRRRLRTSYCYIFGNKKNNSENYEELLRTI